MFHRSKVQFSSRRKDEDRLGTRLLTSDALTTPDDGRYRRLFRKPINARNAAD